MDSRNCYPCAKNFCPIICNAAEINYLIESKNLKGCQVIAGSLHFRLIEEFSDDNNYLDNFKDIEEIHGSLKVYG